MREGQALKKEERGQPIIRQMARAGYHSRSHGADLDYFQVSRIALSSHYTRFGAFRQQGMKSEDNPLSVHGHLKANREA